MELTQMLKARSGDRCELCNRNNDLEPFLVSPRQGEDSNDYAYLCTSCTEQLSQPDKTDVNQWHCLKDSIWSGVPAVQVLAYRMLQRLKGEGWARELFDMMYMEDTTREWAEQREQDEAGDKPLIHRDSNGNLLEAGDSVVLIQDLNVKGANFTAKRGTAVRNISLVHDNAEHLEGKVNGQQLVILTKYVRKA